MHRTTVVLENRDRLYVKLELQENKSVSFKFDGRSEKTIGFFQSIDIRFYCGMVTIIKAINNCSELRDIYCRVGVTRNDNDSLPSSVNTEPFHNTFGKNNRSNIM